ncbi:MAG: DUF3574 domain-containing protein [Verrucomicrobiota bacterium]
MARLLLVLFGCAALSACAPVAPPASTPSHELHRLYFGLDLPEGEAVTPAEWREFLRLEVTPRFPEGLTYWPAHGQWRNQAGTILKENSMILEIVVPPDDREEAVRSLQAIIDAYKRQFRQEAVFWVRADVNAEVR